MNNSDCLLLMKLNVKKGSILHLSRRSARLAALLAACCMAFSGCTDSVQTQEPASPAVEQEQESTFPEEMDAEYYLGDTVFVGDSRTNGLLGYNLLPPEQVFAIDGSTQKTIREEAFIQLEPDGEELTLEEAVRERKPGRILVAFGVNAIPLMTESEFMEEYDALIQLLTEASPDSSIIIQSILPIAWWYDKMPNLTNESIDYYNSLLEDYCEEKGFTFFDISSEFADEDGSLDSRYDAGDGLHFNQTFYHTYLELLVAKHPAAS